MRKLLCCLASIFTMALTGCPLDSPTIPQTTFGGGWILSTVYIDNAVIVAAPYTTVSGTWVNDGVDPIGDANPFTVTTEITALQVVQNGRVPATWDATWVSTSGPYGANVCDGLKGLLTPSHQGATEEFQCIHYGTAEIQSSDERFTFDPSPLNPVSIPTTSTIFGSGFNETYGMPVVQYFDMNGNLMAQQSASAVSADGTTLSLSSPNISEMNAGTYAGVISNIASDGSYQYVGTVAVNVSLPLYRPTTYSDMANSYPSQYTSTITPAGPINGTVQGSYTTTIQAYDDWEIDQNGSLEDVSSEGGQCTWSGFPSGADHTVSHTLYIPYSISTGGGSGSNTGFYTVTATIGGTAITLYASDWPSYGNGVLTAPIPAGTDFSTIQVTVSVIPENQNPGGNPGRISDYMSFDIYAQ